ncbi:MAG: hypothetical protein QOD99_1408 [Chthoniobacter sp.]|jgi:hypothetical protein|nr:hypothetical protein [Chthoniobacter sp.]
MANYYRPGNGVPVAGLTRWIVVSIFLGASGLSYVYLKNQLHAAGDEIHALERQLADLQMQNDVVHSQATRLSSYDALNRRKTEGFIKMVPITDEHIIRVKRSIAKRSDDEMQPVANRGVAK